LLIINSLSQLSKNSRSNKFSTAIVRDTETSAAGSGIVTNLEGGDSAAGVDTGQGKLSSGLRINSRYAKAFNDKSVFVRAVDSVDQKACADSTLMIPQVGKANYRDLILDIDLTNRLISDLDKDCRASRYLGNSSTLELHDLKNEKAACQINEIRADRCVRFKSVKEAEAINYDFCAYCFGKERSKR